MFQTDQGCYLYQDTIWVIDDNNNKNWFFNRRFELVKEETMNTDNKVIQQLARDCKEEYYYGKTVHRLSDILEIYLAKAFELGKKLPEKWVVKNLKTIQFMDDTGIWLLAPYYFETRSQAESIIRLYLGVYSTSHIQIQDYTGV